LLINLKKLETIFLGFVLFFDIFIKLEL
jgi:hypothetical protein